MTNNLSYKEIIANCKLLDFSITTEGVVEVWADNVYIYRCVWAKDTDREIPLTIYKEFKQ